MAQKLAAQLAAQRPNTSLVHMLVQKVSWFSVRLCNILHREKAVPRVVNGKVGIRANMSENTVQCSAMSKRASEPDLEQKLNSSC
jgi:hypothetical protein